MSNARASTIPAMRSTVAADDRKSTGTATTPSSRHPQSAITHSGRFSPQKTIRSPFAMPQARSRAAKPVAACAVRHRSHPHPEVSFIAQKLAAMMLPRVEESSERRRITDQTVSSRTAAAALYFTRSWNRPHLVESAIPVVESNHLPPQVTDVENASHTFCGLYRMANGLH